MPDRIRSFQVPEKTFSFIHLDHIHSFRGVAYIVDHQEDFRDEFVDTVTEFRYAEVEILHSPTQKLQASSLTYQTTQKCCFPQALPCRGPM